MKSIVLLFFLALAPLLAQRTAPVDSTAMHTIRLQMEQDLKPDTVVVTTTDFDSRLMEFNKAYMQFITRLYGCPPDGVGTCHPAEGALDPKLWHQLCTRYQKFFVSVDKKSKK